MTMRGRFFQVAPSAEQVAADARAIIRDYRDGAVERTTAATALTRCGYTPAEALRALDKNVKGVER